MAQPYVGEIRMFGGNFAPVNWMLCQGQTLPISEYEVLFNLIGTTYGGDGQQTFNLPNLASRAPLHMGSLTGTTYQIGEMAGTESVTLTTQQMPMHNHAMMATSTGQTLSPQNATFAVVTSSQAGVLAYAPVAPTTALVASSILPSGGNQPHENMQPFLCINFIISLYGVYPSQT
jgi:microcystin-dependent protein